MIMSFIKINPLQFESFHKVDLKPCTYYPFQLEEKIAPNFHNFMINSQIRK